VWQLDVSFLGDDFPTGVDAAAADGSGPGPGPVSLLDTDKFARKVKAVIMDFEAGQSLSPSPCLIGLEHLGSDRRAHEGERLLGGASVIGLVYQDLEEYVGLRRLLTPHRSVVPAW
jgi:hypothetical protein